MFVFFFVVFTVIDKTKGEILNQKKKNVNKLIQKKKKNKTSYFEVLDGWLVVRLVSVLV